MSSIHSFLLPIDEECALVDAIVIEINAGDIHINQTAPLYRNQDGI
jgi:hypothetical protein